MQRQAKEARDARANFEADASGNEEESGDDEPEREGQPEEKKDGDGDVRMDQQTTEQLQSSHGPFSPPPTWPIMPSPAANEDAWTELKKGMKANCKFWKDKQLAHIFDDGWDLGTFQKREKTHLVFSYSEVVAFKYAHSLLLEEWGPTKSWVVLEQK